MSTSTFAVTGMTCAHCERAVRDEVSKIDGVTGIRVSAADGRLVIDAASDLDDDEVLAAVDEAGYTARRV